LPSVLYPTGNAETSGRLDQRETTKGFLSQISFQYVSSGDALLDKAESTLDSTERTLLYKKAQQILAEEGGAIIPVYSATVGAMRHGCSGFLPHVDMNRISYAEINCN
jgi:ABC-type transport system substrate-binding protein